ncbi:hypothetical protein NKJ73_21310 [Mesorhizobium sp. M0074]|uniref:hypothetical protein n=1 Tax=unclassified Mesorhizobium TaxID=325217 RepID=UPI0033350F03
MHRLSLAALPVSFQAASTVFAMTCSTLLAVTRTGRPVPSVEFGTQFGEPLSNFRSLKLHDFTFMDQPCRRRPR